jgi:hypothetical protein
VNNVNPNPIRAAFTGLTGTDFLSDAFEPLVGPLEVVGFFSGALSGSFVTVAFGRRLLGLAVLPEDAGFCLGRDVKNAPRTSSWSCGADAALPITTAHAQIVAKRSTLNRIAVS